MIMHDDSKEQVMIINHISYVLLYQCSNMHDFGYASGGHVFFNDAMMMVGGLLAGPEGLHDATTKTVLR